MKNFGLSDLFLVSPQRPLDARAFALASHAGDVLEGAKRVEALEEALHGCRFVLGTTARARASETLRVYTPREAAAELPMKGVGVMFGPEDFGLSNSELAHAQGYIRIPTSDYASLNLAQAVQLIAYEWFLAGQNAGQDIPEKSPLPDLAPREALEAMYAQLLDTLHLIGYTDAQREGSANALFRGLFDRAGLNEREVAALRGLWRQTAWAARQPEQPEPAPEIDT